MWYKLLQQIAKYFLIATFFLPTFFSQQANAEIYEGVRQMYWDSSAKRCVGGGYNAATGKHTSRVLNFNPFSNNSDINWELSNGVCLSYIATFGTALTVQEALISNFLCVPSPANVVAQARAAAVTNRALIGKSLPSYLTPATIYRIAALATVCGSALGDSAVTASNCSNPTTAAFYCQFVPVASADASRCCAGAAIYSDIVGHAVAALAIIYGIADGAYQKARICGHDWKTWALVNNDGVPSSDGSTWRKGAYDGSYKQNVQNYITSGATPDLSDQKYREYIFGGKEYEDKGDGACSMPDWSNSRKKEILGYTSGKIKYYMTGPNESPIFACYRFLLAKGTKEEIAAGQSAYDCCTKRSQSVVCIENAGNASDPTTNRYEYRFCEIGSRCNVKGVWFDAYQSQVKTNYACARTYSVCPYNHPIGGGTEKADYSDSSDQATMQNYCQYMNHCSILPIKPYISRSSLTGAFFDSSCRDMKGDSQNAYGYSSNLTPVDVRGFSAPMVQCFKETIQNIFFNQAGSTACLDPDETPDVSGTCSSGYKYKKGDDLSVYQRSIGQSGKSFFVRIQDALRDTIKLALSVAIMFFGVSILIGGGGITKKQLIPFVVKIAFVMYFATGNEWQDWVLDGIIGGSSELSDIMFRTDSLTGSTTTKAISNVESVQVKKYITDASIDQTKLDGCQFPRYNYADSSNETKYDYGAYPPGKEYLRIWDTLDCKIGRALGYGIDVSVPNLVMMILGGLFTGGAGVVFVVATFSFAIFLIYMTIRALHIFILSTVSIIILFYVSPIMVTLIMFNKTKGIFDKWWKNILSFALQPMILFAYLGIVLTLFDNVVMGNVTFRGDGKNVPKEVICSGEAINTSVYCIFNPPVSSAIKNNDQLKILGIGLPVLTSINQTKISTLIKVAVLFFILTSFLDKISDFAKALTGGDAALVSKSISAAEMATKAGGAMRGIQKRGMGMLKKNVGGKAIKMAKSFRSGAASLGSGGRAADQAKNSESGSSTVTSPDDSKSSSSVSSSSSASSSVDSSSGSESSNSGNSKDS